jgi:hypothetical protein
MVTDKSLLQMPGDYNAYTWSRILDLRIWEQSVSSLQLVLVQIYTLCAVCMQRIVKVPYKNPIDLSHSNNKKQW